MKRNLFALGACVVAFALGAGNALADDGQFQLVDQSATTEQSADAVATADQNAVNANVPVQVAGDDANGGTSSANQTADNSADATAANLSGTVQLAEAQQSAGSGDCYVACGGAGQFQTIEQDAETSQEANADATADQNAVNANVPVQVAGHDANGGTSSANQTATNTADATSLNGSLTAQAAKATQSADGGKCHVACGGAGQFQKVDQDADTWQDANSDATADQNAVNANVPVQVAGDDANGGTSSANQTADNNADATAANLSGTVQLAEAEQSAGGGKCGVACGGAGQFQKVDQDADTWQEANSNATANQNAVNANVPVQVAGDDANGGTSSANQTATNSADATSLNKSLTLQLAKADQSADGGHCKLACGGAGQFQKIDQDAYTWQDANSDATADQNAVNANTPVQVAGHDANGGTSSANQDAENDATATSANLSGTLQLAHAEQSAGGSCFLACGGSGQFQRIDQDAYTWQHASSDATAPQNAVNSNAPVQVAGDDTNGGTSSANQTARNSATGTSFNKSFTLQLAKAKQWPGRTCSCRVPCKQKSCGPDERSGKRDPNGMKSWRGMRLDE